MGHRLAPQVVVRGTLPDPVDPVATAGGGEVGGSDEGGGDEAAAAPAAARNAAGLAAALAVLGARADDAKGVKRACDAFLVGWLRHSDAPTRGAWSDGLALHSLPLSTVRSLMNPDGAGGASRAKRAKTSGGAEAGRPIVRAQKSLLALGLTPRPNGRAPGNDQGTLLMWSYKRGCWVDVSGDGTWDGTPAAEEDVAALAAETADVDARLAALAAGGDADDIARASSDEVAAMLAAAKAEAEAAAAAEAEAEADPTAAMDRALPKLEGRLRFDVADRAWFTERLRQGGEGGVAAKLLDNSPPCT